MAEDREKNGDTEQSTDMTEHTGSSEQNSVGKTNTKRSASCAGVPRVKQEK